MALILIEGFEDLGSGPATSLWTFSGGATIVAGRTGNCLQLATGSSHCDYRIPTAQESATVTMGFAYRTSSLAFAQPVAQLCSDAGATIHLTVVVETNGSLTVRNGTTSGTVLATSATGLIAINTWYYLEFQATLSDTVGTVALSRNGTSIASGTSLDTKNAGTKTTFDTIKFNNNGTGAPNTLIDDVYFMAGTGDSFLGDCFVETLFPNGDGTVNQFLGSDGNSVSNYALVNETGNPVTTTYTGSTTVGNKDIYAFGNLVDTTHTVLGVCHVPVVAMATVSPTRQVKIVNHGAVDTKSAAIVLSTIFSNYAYTLALNPEGTGTFGDTQRPTIANVANTNAAVGEGGARYSFARAGQVIGVRYGRVSTASALLTLEAWKDSTGTRMAFIDDTQSAAAGYFTVMFPSPVAIAAGETWTFSYSSASSSIPLGTAGTNIDTADVTFIEYRYNSSPNTYPNLTTPNSCYVEPIFQTPGGLWTMASVNALQAGIEVTV